MAINVYLIAAYLFWFAAAPYLQLFAAYDRLCAQRAVAHPVASAHDTKRMDENGEIAEEPFPSSEERLGDRKAQADEATNSDIFPARPRSDSAVSIE